MTRQDEDRHRGSQAPPESADPSDEDAAPVTRLDDEMAAAEEAGIERDYGLVKSEAARDEVTLPPLPVVGDDDG